MPCVRLGLAAGIIGSSHGVAAQHAAQGLLLVPHFVTVTSLTPLCRSRQLRQ
jgi:hypothetical protein